VTSQDLAARTARETNSDAFPTAAIVDDESVRN
jgi:hypothetical protein